MLNFSSFIIVEMHTKQQYGEFIMAKTRTISGTFDEIVSQIKKLVEEGNARTLIVKNKKGKVVFQTSLSVGLAGGSVAAVMAPILSGLAALAIFMNDLEISVVRDEHKDAQDAEIIEVVDENEQDEENKKSSEAKVDEKKDEK